MKVEELRNLNWVAVTDWSQLTKTHLDNKNNARVGMRDIEHFVENIFRETARKLKVSYVELQPILKVENTAFFSAMQCLFSTTIDGFSKDDERLIELESMFRIPNISDTHKSNVEKILTDFSSLTDIEKLEVLQRLKIATIKVDFLD